MKKKSCTRKVGEKKLRTSKHRKNVVLLVRNILANTNAATIYSEETAPPPPQKFNGTF